MTTAAVSPMLTATLYSGNARDVVARVEVPPFETGFPPVILWGVRSFVRTVGPSHGDYIEVFSFVATVEVIDKNDPRREPEPGAILNGHRGNGSA